MCLGVLVGNSSCYLHLVLDVVLGEEFGDAVDFSVGFVHAWLVAACETFALLESLLGWWLGGFYSLVYVHML